MLLMMKRTHRFCMLGLLLCANQVHAAQWGVIASTYDTLREFPIVGDGSLTETLQEAIQVCRKKRPGQDCFAVAAALGANSFHGQNIAFLGAVENPRRAVGRPHGLSRQR